MFTFTSPQMNVVSQEIHKYNQFNFQNCPRNIIHYLRSKKILNKRGPKLHLIMTTLRIVTAPNDKWNSVKIDSRNQIN